MRSNNENIFGSKVLIYKLCSCDDFEETTESGGTVGIVRAAHFYYDLCVCDKTH